MTSTVISRLELDHPDLGTPGGSALHTAIAAMYTKIGDNMADRYFPISNLNAAASVDCEHNFNTAITNLKFDIYGWNETTGELTYLDETTTPKLSEISIVAKVGNTKKQITVTNNSSGQVDLGIVVLQEVIKLSEGDIKDIDIISVPPEDGQSLVYETSSAKFKPGASGDSSFKFQKLTGTVLTIKKGYMGLSDGSEIYSSVDLSPDLATFIPGANGDYYGYFDRYLFPNFTTVNGRKLLAMTTAQLVFSTTTPDLIGISRYVAIGKVQKSAGVFTNIETLAMRKHDIALGVDGSLLDSIEYTLIGAVGDVGQLNSGHQLAASSFPAAAIGANLSWYNGDSLADESANGRALTSPSGNTYGTGILGDASQAFSLARASSQYLKSTDALFNPGNNDFSVFGWIKPVSWTSGTYRTIFSQAPGAGNYAFILSIINTNILRLNLSTDGTNLVWQDIDVSGLTGWHHVGFKYVASVYTGYLYIDGAQVAQVVLSAGMKSAASPKFNIGAYNDVSDYFDGLIDEIVFAKYAFSDNDIMKLQAAKYTHNKGVASSSQDWKWWIKTATDSERPLDYSPVIAQTLNELFFDLSQESSTCYIARKLIYTGQSGLSKPAQGQTLTITTDQLDAILPITHNCGAVPGLSLMVSNGTDYEIQDVGSLLVVNSTQIKAGDGTFVSLFGSSVNLILSYSSGVPSVFVPNKMWNKVIASSNVTSAVNDRVFMDATSGPYTNYLPANPNVGDECQLLDAKGIFSITKYVTFNPGASNLRGGANTFDCQQPNKLYRAIFVDATYGWDILY